MGDEPSVAEAAVCACAENGWAIRRWTEFGEIETWLAEVIDSWRADRASTSGPLTKPFFCGPEAWGEGRSDPPAPAGRV